MRVSSWITTAVLRKLLVLPPLAVGVLVYVWISTRQDPPTRRPITEDSRLLRIISVPAVDVIPVVHGYGTAEPGQVWRAISEVKGRVESIHPQLASGELIKAGDQLLRLNPAEYELAVAQIEADIQQASAQLEELETQSSNYEALLSIEKESLRLAENELTRFREMQRKNAASQSEVELKEREWLNQLQSKQNLENSLNLIPAEQKSLRASLAVKDTNLKQAEMDLAKTVIVAPFDCRLAEVSIEIGQFLSAGEMLFEAHSIAVTEIETQVAPHDAKRLVDAEHASMLAASQSTEEIRDALSLGVTVRLANSQSTAEWEGDLERIREELDTQTRTLGVVVTVDNPYEKMIPGQRPALVRGMYCEVELRGRIRAGRVVIPRSALHDSHVYVVNAEDRLQRRAVNVDFAQGDFVCLKSGLEDGERLIVSDPTPAVEGLLVKPVNDGELRQRIIGEAAGRAGYQ